MSLTSVLQSLLGSFIGTLGFSALIHAPRRSALPASIIGAIAYMLYWVLLQQGVSEPLAVFAGALVGAFSAQLMAKRLHIISTVFILLSIVAAVPGLGLYRFMAMLGAGEMGRAASVGVSAMICILMIAMGIASGGMLFRTVNRITQKKP